MRSRGGSWIDAELARAVLDDARPPLRRKAELANAPPTGFSPVTWSPMGDVTLAVRELGSIADGLRDSLRDHRGFMHQIRELEGAMLQQLASTDVERATPEPSPSLAPLLTRSEAVQRKRRRRKFARAALGALKKPSLSMVAALAPTILIDSEDEVAAEPEPPPRTPTMTTGLFTLPYSPNRHFSPFVETPSSGGRSMERPPRRSVESRIAIDVDAANRRGAALWAASLGLSSTGTSSNRKFDIYRMLSAVWLEGNEERLAIAQRLQEALDVPAPYGVQSHQVELVGRVHRALCSMPDDGEKRLDKLRLFALVTTSDEEGGYAIDGPPPGRCRADVETWLKMEAARDSSVLPVNRRVAHEAAAAARPPHTELIRHDHVPLVRSPGGEGFEPRSHEIEQIVLTTPPWPPSEQLVAVQSQLDDTRVGTQ